MSLGNCIECGKPARECWCFAMDQRILIAFDGEAWFIRRIANVTHDEIRNEMIYSCDKHFGGPYKTLDSAVCDAHLVLSEKSADQNGGAPGIEAGPSVDELAGRTRSAPHQLTNKHQERKKRNAAR